MKIKLYSNGENLDYCNEKGYINNYKKENGGYIGFIIDKNFIEIKEQENNFKDYILTMEDKYYNVCFASIEDNNTIYKYETIHINFLRHYFNYMDMLKKYYYFTLVIKSDESITIRAFTTQEEKEEYFNRLVYINQLKDFRIIHYLKWNKNTIHLIKEVEQCFLLDKLEEYKKIANLNLRRSNLIWLINQYKYIGYYMDQENNNLSNEDILNTLKEYNNQHYIKLKDYLNMDVEELKLKEYESILKECENEARQISINKILKERKETLINLINQYKQHFKQDLIKDDLTNIQLINELKNCNEELFKTFSNFDNVNDKNYSYEWIHTSFKEDIKRFQNKLLANQQEIKKSTKENINFNEIDLSNLKEDDFINNGMDTLKQFQNENSFIDWSKVNKQDFINNLKEKIKIDFKQYENEFKENRYKNNDETRAQKIKEIIKSNGIKQN